MSGTVEELLQQVQALREQLAAEKAYRQELEDDRAVLLGENNRLKAAAATAGTSMDSTTITCGHIVATDNAITILNRNHITSAAATISNACGGKNCVTAEFLVSNSEEIMLCAGVDSMVTAYSLEGASLHAWSMGAPVLSLSVRGTKFACGMMDGSHAVVTVPGGSVRLEDSTVQRWHRHNKYVVQVAWSPDGQHLCTVSHDKKVIIYRKSSDSGEMVETKEITCTTTPECAAFITASFNDHSWQDMNKVPHRETAPFGGDSRDPETLEEYFAQLRADASRKESDAVAVSRIEDGSAVSMDGMDRTEPGSASRVELVLGLRDVPYLVYMNCESFETRQVSLNENAWDAHVSFTPLSLMPSPGGERLLVATDKHMHLILRTGSNQRLQVLSGHSCGPYGKPAVRWDCTGDFVYGNSEDDNCVFVYDAATGKVVDRLKGHGAGLIRGLATHPTEQKLLSVSYDKSMIFDFPRFPCGILDHVATPVWECAMSKPFWEPNLNSHHLLHNNNPFMMKKGDKCNLPANSKKLCMGVGWTPLPQTTVDMDLMCLMLRKGAEGAYFPFDLVNGISDGSRSVRPGAQHMGDNTNGDGDGDDENVVMDLTLLESEVQAVAVIVTTRDGSFSDVKDSYVRIADYDNSVTHAKYNLDGSITKKGFVYCLLERGSTAEDPWSITVTAEEVNAKSATSMLSKQWKSFYGATGLQISTADASPLISAEEWHARTLAQQRARLPDPPSVARQDTPPEVDAVVDSAPTPAPAPAATAAEGGAAADSTGSDNAAAATEAAADADAGSSTNTNVSAADAFTAGAGAGAVAMPSTFPQYSCEPVEDCLSAGAPLPQQTGEVVVNVSWPMEVGGAAADLDVSAVTFDAMGRRIDAVYYNQHSALNGALTHSGDSHCGEHVKVKLADVAGARVIVFTLSGYSGGDTHVCDETKCTVTMGGETLATITLADADTSSHPSMVLCMLYRHPENRIWHYSRILHPSRGRDFMACMKVIQRTVDQVIDQNLIEERTLLRDDRVFNMKKGDYATVPRDFHRMLVGLGWVSKVKDVDLDVSCLMLRRTEDGKLPTPYDMASTKHDCKVRPGVQHFGDNTSGHGAANEDKEQILVDLTLVEDTVDALVFVVTNQDGKNSFRDVSDAYVDVKSADGRQVYASYTIGNHLTKSAVVFCMLSRGENPGDPWRLTTIGEEVAKGKSARLLLFRLWEGYLASPGQVVSTARAEPMVAGVAEPESPRRAAVEPTLAPAPAPAPAASAAAEPAAAAAATATDTASADQPAPAAPAAPAASEPAASETPAKADVAQSDPTTATSTTSGSASPAPTAAAPAPAPAPAAAPTAPSPQKEPSLQGEAAVVVDNPNAACCVIS